MLRYLFAFVLLAHAVSVAAIGISAQAGTPVPMTVLRGVVVDEAAVPLPRARVTIGSAAGAAPAFTGDDGRFELRAPAVDGNAVVQIGRAGFLSQERPARELSSFDVPVRLVRAAVISGQVVDVAGNPAAVIGVRLRRSDDGRTAPFERTAITDDRGAFRFGSLPPGLYELQTERAVENQVFLERLSGQAAVPRERAGPPLSDIERLDLSSGQELIVALRHHERAVIQPYASVGGVVTGQLVDPHGDPAEGVDVTLWRMRYRDGRRTIEPVEALLSRRMFRTDDRGQFRIYHVPPGAYYVVATEYAAGSARRMEPDTLLPVYYPGRTSVADAVPIQVSPGRTQDVQMVFARAAGARVSGVAVDAGGAPLAAGDVTAALLGSHRPGAIGLPPRLSSVDEQGRFLFDHVPPGEYVVQVTRMVPVSNGRFDIPVPGAFGAASVTVGDVDVPVNVVIAPTAMLSGRIVLDGSARLASPRDLWLQPVPVTPDEAPVRTLGPLDRSPAAAVFHDDWTFTMGGLTGLTTFTLANAPPGWWLKSVSVAGANAADEPVFFARGDVHADVTVVLAHPGASIRGGVLDDRGSPADDFRVIAFATSPLRWLTGSSRVRIAGPAADGGFEIAGLPPGEYHVAAVDVVEGDALSGEWQDPVFLTGLIPWSRRVAVGDGERQQVDLRLLRTGR